MLGDFNAIKKIIPENYLSG